VRDDHVAEGAGLLVEAGPAADREGLRNVDLDAVDVVAVPDRLEDPVRKAAGEDVLDGLLSEEWSIRNTCDSSNTAWTVWFSDRAEARSVPNGFSMIIRARSARPVRRRVSTMPADAAGGTER
jgi:hypothetical protein